MYNRIVYKLGVDGSATDSQLVWVETFLKLVFKLDTSLL